ncbi:MAG TPA: alpha/beta hydrolase [Streptosporangiaceae bacterium]
MADDKILVMPWTRPAGGQTRLFYTVAGAGPRTVVFVHGLAGHGGEWTETAAELAGTCMTICLDQRAHGRSTRRPADLGREAFADDVAAVVEAAGAPGPVTLVGQSMGAHTALVTAGRHPGLASHLVLVEGDVGGGGADPLDKVDRAIAAWPASFVSEKDVRDFFGGDTRAGRAWAGGYAEREGRWWPRFDPASVRPVMSPVFSTERWDIWDRLTIPVDLVVAERSTIDAARIGQMRRRPGTGYHVIAGAGHDLHLDQHERWIQALGEILDR